jgi:hypothetical protein
MDWATIWAIFSPTNLVALVPKRQKERSDMRLSLSLLSTFVKDEALKHLLRDWLRCAETRAQTFDAI